MNKSESTADFFRRYTQDNSLMTKTEYSSVVLTNKRTRDVELTIILIISTWVRLERWDSRRDDTKINSIALDKAESWPASRWYCSRWNSST